jgi:hypothetical protein
LNLSVGDLGDRSAGGGSGRSLDLSITDLRDRSRHGDGVGCLDLSVADLRDDSGWDLWLSVSDLGDWYGGRSLSLSV